MSEFSKQWPVSDSFGEHARYIQQGLDVVESQLFLPTDGRVQIAYGALASGRKSGAVLAEGEPGTGKSDFGNIIFGESNVTNVQPTDTAETLMGYQRPTDGVFNKGTMKIDPENPMIMLDEVAHLGNTGPLHDLWNGNTLHLPGGDVVDTTHMPIYATANFFDGHRNKLLDNAFRSRFGIGVLFGDANEDIARRIHGRDIESGKTHVEREGILPNLAARAALGNMLGTQFPFNEAQIGSYITEVLKRLNDTGVVHELMTNDARTSQGWQVATRAKTLVDGGRVSKDEINLNKEDFSRVAALALGASVSLSQVGKSQLGNHIQSGRRVSDIDAQVAARRLTAAVAYDVALDMEDYPKQEDKRADFTDKYAYANHPESGKIDGFINDVLATQVPVEQDDQDGKKRGFFRRRTS